MADPEVPRQFADAGDNDQYQHFQRQQSSLTWAQFLRHIRGER